MRRGKLTKREAKLIPVWMPEDMVVAIDVAILQEDSDRSKFVRNAVRDRMKRLGIKLPEAA